MVALSLLLGCLVTFMLLGNALRAIESRACRRRTT